MREWPSPKSLLPRRCLQAEVTTAAPIERNYGSGSSPASRPPSPTRFRRGANLAEKLQNVMAVTEAPSKFWQEPQITRGADHEKVGHSLRPGLRIHHRNGGRDGHYTHRSGDGGWL